jgi:hypothetical protein
MSSPKSRNHLDYENSIDFKKMDIFIKSVDETKPLGKLVKLYGEQKYVDGYWTGLFTGVCCGFALGVAVAVCVRR